VNRFTGWIDAPLSDQGRQEARAIASKISGFRIDTAYSSALQRTIESLEIVLKELVTQPIPVVHARELNERSYGDLQGLNKDETAARFGKDLVHTWRRGYTTAPPNGESLQQAGIRILEFFHARILLDIQHGLNALVVAHGNTIRVIVKELDHLTDEDIMDVNIATGEVLLYEYDALTRLVGKRVL
jgi:2,3-bisphosphoglycerate-dependent phosphoglycerate mutase